MRKFYHNFVILLFLLMILLEKMTEPRTFGECLEDIPSCFSAANLSMDFSIDDLKEILDLYASYGGVL